MTYYKKHFDYKKRFNEILFWLLLLLAILTAGLITNDLIQQKKDVILLKMPE